MLTHEQIGKAARLMQQVGELRPGFLKDDASALEGPADHGSASPTPANVESQTDKDVKKIQINLVFKKDPVTGDIQIVKE